MIPKTLKDALEFIPHLSHTIHPRNFEMCLNGITFSSKNTNPNDIFFAIPGINNDGHDYLDQAFENGCLAAVVERSEVLNGRPGIVVVDSREALAHFCSDYYDTPSSKMSLIGITGTNGKTTTNWLIYNLLIGLKSPSIRFGTLGTYAQSGSGETVISNPDTLTTPDPIEITKAMNEAINHGVKNCVMEISSHALQQHRTSGLQLDIAVFTNLTQDHLDYHGTFEEYYQAKKIIFNNLLNSKKKRRIAIININNEYGLRLVKEFSNTNLKIITYGDHQISDIQIQKISQCFTGSEFYLRVLGNEVVINTNLIGHHNAENISAAVAVCISLGHSVEDIAGKIPALPQVPGRLESCGTAEFGIFVDYAHTPDALENVLKAIRPIVKNNLWVIFGCGGDRDRAKRPLMAEIAVSLADKAVLTSDNPRTEDPESIIKDVLQGGVKPTIIEVDRRVAIQKTIASLSYGDVLLITGKGHEDYQIIGKTKFPFSDIEEVKKCLK